MRVVWVVDDSTLDLERARRTLEPHYRVRTFDDGASVLEALATNGRPPDVLVLDWLMPSVSGVDVCRFVRGAAGLSSMALLLLTVHQRTEQIVEGLGAGANDFLSKPYAEAELRARVGALARSRELLERAERAERALQHILANSPDALLGLDDGGAVTYANLEAEAVLGCSRESLEGRHIASILPGFEGWQREDAGEGAPGRRDLRIGGQTYAPEVRVSRQGGTAFIVSLRNVTAQRRADAQRLDFYSTAAHDLRSPVSSALLRLEMLLGKGPELIAPKARHHLHQVERNLRDLVHTVNDFLELARSEESSFVRELVPLELERLVRDVTDDFRPLAEANRLKMDLEVPAEPVVVAGDRRRLKQVLGNLLENAIKFTPPGGALSVRLAAGDGHAIVEVSDSGRGIAPDALSRVFERYARTLDAEYETTGTGLGLMIVRETVEAHGGRVGVKSRLGEGSTFWFTLPRLEPKTRPRSA